MAQAGGVWAAPPPSTLCRAQLQPPAATVGSRDITSDDLVRVRDLGRPEEQIGVDPILSVSPDGAQVAFQLRRADPTTNSYCLGIFVLDLDATSPPRLVDEGGDIILTTLRDGPAALRQPGYPELIVPRWSPDGLSLAYLRREGGITQARVVDLRRQTAFTATRSPVDVEVVGWAQENLIFSSRPDVLNRLARILDEGATGYLYDRRFIPIYGSRPMAPGGAPVTFSEYRSTTGQVEPAAPADIARSSMTPAADRPPEAVAFASRGGVRAWTYALPSGIKIPTGSKDPGRLYAAKGLKIVGPRWNMQCEWVECTDAMGVWLEDTGRRLLFLRREGWRGKTTTLYEWRRGKRQPRAVFSTLSNIVGCDLAKSGLVCGEESPTQPRRLVLINPDHGGLRVLFDPNPEFIGLRFGQVVPLEWSNGKGYEAVGKLVLPPHAVPGERPPLIVVQYQNRGFLRGGTGDEFPIHVLAARGFAVLALDRPGVVQLATTTTGVSKDWEDRKNVHASLEAGLNRVLQFGFVDPKRMGITGLSNGAATAQYAMLNSHWFSAAVLSSCCDDEYMAPFVGPTGAADLFQSGRPAPAGDLGTYRNMSMAQNAAQMDVPMLIQSSDSEYLVALTALTALKVNRKPVELFVYPDERHVIWQPRHRAMIYERGVDWFNFWLRCVEDSIPAKTEQYSRWKALRADTGNMACTAH
jgi:dipeptidyl aminopeptidase/acylaminoacyl peptidase